MAAVQSLPDNFITINPMSLNSQNRDAYRCLICQQDSVYQCTLCRSCYCCREHLDQDNQACHQLICSIKKIIFEMHMLPLAEQNRASTKKTLKKLQDQIRQICYLQAKKHILSNNLICALPAAERSLDYAIQVNGPNSILLIEPLLALANVSSAAGNKAVAIQNINRAQLLLETQMQSVLQSYQFKNGLLNILNKNINSMLDLDHEYCKKELGQEIKREMHRSSLSSRLELSGRSNSVLSNKSTGPGSDGEPSAVDSVTVRAMQGGMNGDEQTAHDALLQQQFRNYSKDEVYRYQNQGRTLASCKQMMYQIRAAVHYRSHEFIEALYEQSSAVYYAALCNGIESLQFVQQLGYMIEYGSHTSQISKEQCAAIQTQINQLYCKLTSKHFSKLLQSLTFVKQQNFIQDDVFQHPLIQRAVQAFIDQEGANDELRLAFQSDYKEAMKMAKDVNEEESDPTLKICLLLGMRIVGADSGVLVHGGGMEVIKRFLRESQPEKMNITYINDEYQRVNGQRQVLRQVILYVFAKELMEDAKNQQSNMEQPGKGVDKQ